MKIDCVVKRGASKVCHPYDEEKIYGSVYAACIKSIIGK